MIIIFVMIIFVCFDEPSSCPMVRVPC